MKTQNPVLLPIKINWIMMLKLVFMVIVFCIGVSKVATAKFSDRTAANVESILK